ncbi:MAG: DUF4440 domain-containing protein [Candidatus Saccharibacteria bacterium]|nr:DUF4440 domain-containing protein [Candidatus Saccharibacteria bacterium]
MNLNETDLRELEKLEESLWERKTRFDNDYMRSVLADDFLEFGRSGKVYDLEESLSAPDQEIKAKLPLKDFSVHQIDETVALVTYVSQVEYDSLEVSNRSSLWQNTGEGWKLKFHQGTPVNP